MDDESIISDSLCGLDFLVFIPPNTLFVLYALLIFSEDDDDGGVRGNSRDGDSLVDFASLEETKKRCLCLCQNILLLQQGRPTV